MRTLSTLIALAVLLAAVPFTGHAEEEPALINAEFEDADVKMVIAAIAEAGKANVIVSPKVEGKMTLKLKDIPWRAALEQVVTAVGAAVVEEEHGILRVLPKAEAERTKVFVNWKELGEKKLAESRKKLAESRSALEGLEKARKEAAAKAAELERRTAEMRKAAAKALGARSQGVQVLQFHDVKDLIAKHPQLPARVQRIEPHAEIELRKGVLVVRAAPAGQEKVTQLLTELRLQGRLVGPDGKPRPGAVPHGKKGEQPPVLSFSDGKTSRRATLMGKGKTGQGQVIYVFLDEKSGKKYLVSDGKVTAVDGDGKPVEDAWGKPYHFSGLKSGKYEIVLEQDEEGRYVARAKSTKPLTVKVEQKGTATRSKKGGKVRLQKERRGLVLREKFDVEALKAFKKARDLEAAARHLKAAGDEKGADELYRRAREAYEAAKRHEEKHGGEGSLLDAVNGLRRDVHQLRGEVRELTGLVRQLLSRRAGGAGGGAFTGRSGGTAR